jgi:DNA-directed RNA polymerase specialized sigma24 family protein
MAAVMRIAGEPGTDVTDAEIIRLSLREPDLFAEILDRYYTEIHGYVVRRLGSSLADDVTAETFLIAFDRRDRYDVTHPLARVGAHDRVDGHADRIERRVDAESARGLLATALAAIAPGDRDVLLLVAWAGLSGEEAARALGIPAGTLAVAVAAGVIVVQTADGTDKDRRPRSALPGIPAGPVATAAQALDRAAAAADARPFTPPRPDQWIYTELRIRTSVNGRPAIALGRTAEGWLHEEVLLDPKSYAYLGERAISIKGHTSRGRGDDPNADATYVKKGVLQNLTVRTAAGIVDAPGRRTS